MEIDKKIFVFAGVITIILFGLIYIANELLNYKREATLNELRDDVIDDLENMKAFTAISGLIGEEENCNILQSQLKFFDKSIWDLGIKLDSYEEASRNIFGNPYYEKQKKRFIVNQILYLSILEKMKKTCNTKTPVTLIYFYANKKDCLSCDDQSFVLTDINKEYDEEIAVFSLDTDIEVMGTQVLQDYYNITKTMLPCTIIENKLNCGLMDKKTVIKHICKEGTLSVCHT
jgi:hypothetical protein